MLFVDEMHLFNEQERLVFHQLLTRLSSANPVVIMALDPKQSPAATFIPLGADEDAPQRGIFYRAALGNPEEIVLTEVFRYTPEIAAIVNSVDAIFPTLELGGEDWKLPVVQSKRAGGNVPTVSVFRDAKEQVRTTFSQAHKAATSGAGNRVAVLCLEHERFDDYVRSETFASWFHVIASRDDTERLKYSTQRFVLSQPEHVAGLQFEHVYLLDCNKDNIRDQEDNGYALREFLSSLYLGITRAEKYLSFSATEDRGGLSEVLERVANEGLVKRQA